MVEVSEPDAPSDAIEHSQRGGKVLLDFNHQTSAMSSSISTLLTRNLHDVFGENDPARRRAASSNNADLLAQPRVRSFIR